MFPDDGDGSSNSVGICKVGVPGWCDKFAEDVDGSSNSADVDLCDPVFFGRLVMF